MNFVVVVESIKKIFTLAKELGPALFEYFSKKKEAAPAPQPTADASAKVVVSVPDVTANTTPAPPNITHTIVIPEKTETYTGSQFAATIMSIAPNQNREDVIYAQYAAGNVPDFMRTPQPITVNSQGHKLTYWVLPDVLCVGSNEDYLRTPLNPLTAMRVGELFNCTLPTRKMAMQIWAAAPTKLTPIPNGPPYDETMQTTATFVSHNNKIQAALKGTTPGPMITGHKKDVVICAHLLSDPSRVAIYGWFNPNGSCIQGLNPVSHDKLYKDYSHGIRMVSRNMLLDGNNINFYDLLKNPSLASLISDEGAYDASHVYKG